MISFLTDHRTDLTGEVPNAMRVGIIRENLRTAVDCFFEASQ